MSIYSRTESIGFLSAFSQMSCKSESATSAIVLQIYSFSMEYLSCFTSFLLYVILFHLLIQRRWTYTEQLGRLPFVPVCLLQRLYDTIFLHRLIDQREV